MTKAEYEKFLRMKLATDKRWAIKALTRIADNQVGSELLNGTAYFKNNIGFTSNDSKILSSFAVFYKRHNYLSQGQTNIVLEKMPKYARQLMRMDYFDTSKLEKIINKSKNI